MGGFECKGNDFVIPDGYTCPLCLAVARTIYSGIFLSAAMQPYTVSLLGMLLLLTPACDRSQTAPHGRIAEAYVPDSGSVGFDITSFESVNGSLRLTAIYTSQGRIAKFQLEFGTPRAVGTKDSKDFPMKVGEGRFVSVSGSDASVLLLDLKKALEARALPSKVRRLESLPFTFANIGENLSQAANGGFNAEPPGNWTAIKIFMGASEQEAQLFLNINEVSKKGQFSMKDPDYGDLALAQLAEVL